MGKFIISMCQSTSDILTVLFLMKLVGMLESKNGKIVSCPFDVTGLFETIKDLLQAPTILTDLISIPVIRQYLIEHRHGKVTVMVGYSDSVRDGSALASDAQIINTTLALKEMETKLNDGRPSNQRIQLILYRGRGDTLPRGYGGSVTKAVSSQLLATPQEDHTEQNRFLRRYFTVSSAVDHLHTIYVQAVLHVLSRPTLMSNVLEK